MRGCNQTGITGAAFAHLRGIRKLFMLSSDWHVMYARAQGLHVVFT